MLEYMFIRHALFAAIAASIICGIIGTIIVEKKMVMLSGGIAHASFGGIGIGYYIGIEPILGGFVFAILSALAIVGVNKRIGTQADTFTAILWSFGMAIGILFVALMPGYPPDMTSYLFGDLLTVSRQDVYFIGFLTIVTVIIFGTLFNYWKAYLFDEEFLAVRGVNLKLFEYLFYILVSVAVVILVKVVGIILIIALITIPTSVAKIYTYNFKLQMFISMVIGIMGCLAGLFGSYFFDLPSGAVIILFLSFLYFINYIFAPKLIKH